MSTSYSQANHWNTHVTLTTVSAQIYTWVAGHRRWVDETDSKDDGCIICCHGHRELTARQSPRLLILTISFPRNKTICSHPLPLLMHMLTSQSVGFAVFVRAIVQPRHDLRTGQQDTRSGTFSSFCVITLDWMTCKSRSPQAEFRLVQWYFHQVAKCTRLLYLIYIGIIRSFISRA